VRKWLRVLKSVFLSGMQSLPVVSTNATGKLMLCIM